MPRHTSPTRSQAYISTDAVRRSSSVQSLYVAELRSSLRTRLALEPHARRMPIVVEPPIARLVYGSADIK
jgi:hypothetical protein